jgi:putative copper export protein
MVLVKATLFAALFGFAWINRYRLVPALLGSYADISKRRLTLSIALQTGFGLTIVIAAGLLSSLPPGVHAHQSGKSQVIWIAG